LVKIGPVIVLDAAAKRLVNLAVLGIKIGCDDGGRCLGVLGIRTVCDEEGRYLVSAVSLENGTGPGDVVRKNGRWKSGVAAAVRRPVSRASLGILTDNDEVAIGDARSVTGRPSPSGAAMATPSSPTPSGPLLDSSKPFLVQSR
jgi:hypothetical protein